MYDHVSCVKYVSIPFIYCILSIRITIMSNSPLIIAMLHPWLVFFAVLLVAQAYSILLSLYSCDLQEFIGGLVERSFA